MAMHLKVMFDSSHYSPGTAINVRYRVWCGVFGWFEENSTLDPVVKNTLMIFQHPTPPAPNPVPVVSGIFTGRNYDLAPEDGSSWTKAHYFNILEASTATYYGGHGAVAFHSAPSGDGMTVGLYQTERPLDIGTGLPPFNSTSSSSIFFFHLQACNCGDTDDFVAALYPYYMGWGGVYLENQAVLAYSVFLRSSDRDDNARIVWGRMSQGHTARATRTWIRDSYLPSNSYGLQVSDLGKEPITDWRDPTISDFNLICGPDNGAARLKTVYTGDQMPPTSATTPWFRPL